MPESKTRTCTVPGCERKHKGRGYCELHRHRAVAGLPLDAPIQNTKPPFEKRTRTSSGAVQLAVTLQAAMAQQLLEEAGDAYGAQAKLVRQAIVQYLENRDTTYWRRKYQEERSLRLAAQQKLDAARSALS